MNCCVTLMMCTVKRIGDLHRTVTLCPPAKLREYETLPVCIRMD